MRNDLHELAVVLDQTATAEKYLDEFAKSFKTFIKSQKEMNCSTNFTVTSYGSEFIAHYDGVPLEKVKIQGNKLNPNGVSNFLDSAAETIDLIGKRLAATAENERPSRVIVVLTVFGRDNASKKVTYEQLNEIIARQTNIYNWKFFLVTDFSIVMEKLGISPDDTTIFQHESYGMKKAWAEISEKITECRKETLAINA